MSLICKNKHVYGVPHTCVVRRVLEEVDHDGYPIQRTEDFNMLTRKAVDSIAVSNFSLETQLASNQPIKRVSTLRLEPTEISQNQLNQLEERFEMARQAEQNKIDEPNKD